MPPPPTKSGIVSKDLFEPVSETIVMVSLEEPF